MDDFITNSDLQSEIEAGIKEFQSINETFNTAVEKNIKPIEQSLDKAGKYSFIINNGRKLINFYLVMRNYVSKYFITSTFQPKIKFYEILCFDLIIFKN